MSHAVHPQPHTLTPAKLCRRWNISQRRLTALVSAGIVVPIVIPGAYGLKATKRFELSEVERCEQEWKGGAAPAPERKKRTLSPLAQQWFGRKN